VQARERECVRVGTCIHSYTKKHQQKVSVTFRFVEMRSFINTHTNIYLYLYYIIYAIPCLCINTSVPFLLPIYLQLSINFSRWKHVCIHYVNLGCQQLVGFLNCSVFFGKMPNFCRALVQNQNWIFKGFLLIVATQYMNTLTQCCMTLCLLTCSSVSTYQDIHASIYVL